VEGSEPEILRQCFTCGACNEYCKKGAHPHDRILQLQEEKLGGLPAPEAVFTEHKWLASMPGQLIKGDPGKPVLSLALLEPLLPPGAVEGQMFEGLTVVKGAGYGSGFGAVHVGRESPLRKGGQIFVDKLASLGVPEIVFLHADCYALLANKVRDYGIKVPFRPIHYVEYMLSYLRDHQTNIAKLGKKIAYQRPCAERYAPEVEGMLDEIFDLIGVKRVARKHDREDALCCCGTAYASYYPEKAQRIQDMNLADAKEHGADAMTFSCVYCFNTLKEPCQKRGMAPIFITDLCRMALGEKPFPS